MDKDEEEEVGESTLPNMLGGEGALVPTEVSDSAVAGATVVRRAAMPILGRFQRVVKLAQARAHGSALGL